LPAKLPHFVSLFVFLFTMGQCFKPMKVIDAPVDPEDAAFPTNNDHHVPKGTTAKQPAHVCDIADTVTVEQSADDIDLDREHSVESSLSILSHIAMENRPSYTPHPHAQIETLEALDGESMDAESMESLEMSIVSDEESESEFADAKQLSDLNANILSRMLSSYLNDNEDDALTFKLANVRANDTALAKARLVRVARDVYGFPADKSVVLSVRPTVSLVGDCVLMRGRITAKALDEAVNVATIAMAMPMLEPPVMTTMLSTSMAAPSMAAPMFVDYNDQDETSFGNVTPSLSNLSIPSPLEMESESSHSALCCFPDTYSSGISTDAPQISVRMALGEDVSVMVARDLLQDECGLPFGVAREVLEFVCVSFCCRVVPQSSEYMGTECEDVCFVDVRVSEV